MWKLHVTLCLKFCSYPKKINSIKSPTGATCAAANNSSSQQILCCALTEPFKLLYNLIYKILRLTFRMSRDSSKNMHLASGSVSVEITQVIGRDLPQASC